MTSPFLSNATNKDTRYPFLFLVLVAFAALAAAVFYYFTGPNLVMPWEIITEAEAVNLPVDQVQVLLQEFPVQLKGFILTEKFETGLPQPNLVAANIFLLLISLSLVYFLALASTLRQTLFFAALLLLMVFLATFNFDLLGIYNAQKQYLLISILAILGGTTFLLQAFFPNISLKIRLLLFALLVTGIAVFLYTTAPLPANHITLHLLNYSSSGCLVAALLFIFWVSFENILGLLWFNTQSENPQRRYSIWQFLLIAALYLLNLFLLYFRQSGLFDLDIILLNSFLILILSATIGFWGTAQRERIYASLISFNNGVSFLYLVFATLTFASIGYAFATANDSLIRTFSDFIVYTHLAYGFIFLVYILVNFGRLLIEKLRVYRVAFAPKVIPFYTVYIMGSILLVALLFRTDYKVYDRAVAGYYNYLGDFYKTTQGDILALKFYAESSVYEPNNLKATYGQAAIYREKDYWQSEVNQLNEALRFYPNPKVYIRLANKYPDQQHFFDRMFALKAGLRQFPENVPLLNNQALVYSETSMVDSAAYFFNRAAAQEEWQNTITSNRLAFYLLNGLGKEAITLAQIQKTGNHLPLTSNLLLLESFTKQKLETQPLAVPTAARLLPETFTSFYHGVLRERIPANKIALNQINKYLASEENAIYHLDLKILKAYVQQRLNQALAARTTLENLAGTEETYSAYLLDLIGLQLLQQKLYAEAADHFARAQAKGSPDAPLHHLYALAFLPDRATDALLLAAELTQSNDATTADQAARLEFLLQASANQIMQRNQDSLKVQYLQLNQGTNSSLSGEEFSAIAGSIKKAELKLIAQKELAAYYVANQDWAAAKQVLAALSSQLKKPGPLLSELNILKAEIMLQTGQVAELAQALPRLHFQGPDQNLKLYYQAQIAERLNKTAEARRLYTLALTAMPFHLPTVLNAANFFNTKINRKTQAYEALLNSITYNPHEPEVYKAYILQSVEVGYAGFAESALEDLAALISPTEMQAFRQEYQAKVQQREAALGIGGA